MLVSNNYAGTYTLSPQWDISPENDYINDYFHFFPSVIMMQELKIGLERRGASTQISVKLSKSSRNPFSATHILFAETFSSYGSN